MWRPKPIPCAGPDGLPSPDITCPWTLKNWPSSSPGDTQQCVVHDPAVRWKAPDTTSIKNGMSVYEGLLPLISTASPEPGGTGSDAGGLPKAAESGNAQDVVRIKEGMSTRGDMWSLISSLSRDRRNPNHNTKRFWTGGAAKGTSYCVNQRWYVYLVVMPVAD
jgi:hypothetical protein